MCLTFPDRVGETLSCGYTLKYMHRAITKAMNTIKKVLISHLLNAFHQSGLKNIDLG